MAGLTFGGWSKDPKGTEEIQKMCDEVKPEILKYAGRNTVELFKAFKYKTQVVEGTHYEVKIQATAGGEWWHVMLLKSSEGVQVVSVETEEDADDIKYTFPTTKRHARTMYCPFCGAFVQRWWEFCCSCGLRLPPIFPPMPPPRYLPMSKTKTATWMIQQMCDEVKHEILEEVGEKKEAIFQTLEYRFEALKDETVEEHRISGMTYYVKIQVTSEGVCRHAKLFKQKDNTPVQFKKVVTDKKEADEITPF